MIRLLKEGLVREVETPHEAEKYTAKGYEILSGLDEIIQDEKPEKEPPKGEKP